MTLKKICTNANLDRVLLRIENSVMIVTYLILICLVGGETVRRAIFQEQATCGGLRLRCTHLSGYLGLPWQGIVATEPTWASQGSETPFLRLSEEYWKSSMQFYGWPLAPSCSGVRPNLSRAIL